VARLKPIASSSEAGFIFRIERLIEASDEGRIPPASKTRYPRFVKEMILALITEEVNALKCA